VLDHRPLELHLDLNLVALNLNLELGTHPVRDAQAHLARPEREFRRIADFEGLGQKRESNCAASSRLSDSLRSTFTSDMASASLIRGSDGEWHLGPEPVPALAIVLCR
jgi:hypothetical protein